MPHSRSQRTKTVGVGLGRAAACTSELVGKRRDGVGNGRKGRSGSESGDCGVFAKVIAKIGQREVDVAMTCWLDELRGDQP